MPPSDWPSRKSVRRFSDWALMSEGSAHCGWRHLWGDGPGLFQKVNWGSHRCKLVRALRPLLPGAFTEFLPSLSSMTDCRMLAETDPFLLRVFMSWCFSRQQKADRNRRKQGPQLGCRKRRDFFLHCFKKFSTMFTEDMCISLSVLKVRWGSKSPVLMS